MYRYFERSPVNTPARRASVLAFRAETPVSHKTSSLCSCGGGCPRCQTSFQRDVPTTANGKNPRTTSGHGEWTLVDGFPIDTRYCFCDGQIEKELAWTRRMTDLFREYKHEAPKDGVAADAIAYKNAKLKQAGIETEAAGSVSVAGQVHVEDWPGPCGPIFRFGVGLHEGVHDDYLARGQAKDEEPRKVSDLTAREFAASEVKAYTREAKFLEHMLKALEKRCTAGDYGATDPEYYRHSCNELDLEMGLNWARGTTWGRPEVEGPWPGLKGKCWWYLDRPNGGYNCYGYALKDEEGVLTVIEPKLQTIEQANAYFTARGYARSSGSGDIAWFSGSHAARRSHYTFAGRQLWESKLSREAPLILHELKDIEGDAFGEVKAFYSRTNASPAGP